MDLIVRRGRLDGRDGLWDVGVAAGRIVTVAERISDRAPAELAAEGGLVAPSFVDLHTHLDKALTASRAAAAGRARSLAAMIEELRAIKRRFTAEDVRERAVRVAGMAAARGTGVIRSAAEADPFVELRAVEGMLAARAAAAPLVDLRLTAAPQEGWFATPGTLEAGSAPFIEAALARGLDAVGGNVNAVLWPSSPEAQVDAIFALARRFDADVDLHLDNADVPDAFTLPYVIEQTMRHGWEGRVVVGHVASLAAVGAAEAAAAIDGLRRARVSVAVLPTRIRLTRVRELVEAGVNVLCGTDNQRDPFVRHGNADVLATMLLLAQLTGMRADDELRAVWAMGTGNGARA
ncbi:MAG: amidohydrolase family protein, partial [Candidatus Rokuibacteriota bacterium]